MTRTGKAVEADVAYIDAGETLRRAGHLMRELGVGVLVVRGENGQIQGTISRDMVVRRIAAGNRSENGHRGGGRVPSPAKPP